MRIYACFSIACRSASLNQPIRLINGTTIYPARAYPELPRIAKRVMGLSSSPYSNMPVTSIFRLLLSSPSDGPSGRPAKRVLVFTNLRATTDQNIARTNRQLLSRSHLLRSIRLLVVALTFSFPCLFPFKHALYPIALHPVLVRNSPYDSAIAAMPNCRDLTSTLLGEHNSPPTFSMVSFYKIRLSIRMF